MDVSSIYGYGYSPAVSLINALYPASSVGSASGIGSLLSLTGIQASISNAGSLLNSVETLQSAAQALTEAGKFDARTVASSNAKVATASASPGTANGSYAIEVKQLAQAQTLTTSAQASSLTPLGSGPATLNFQFASGQTRQVSISGNDNTLSGIASAINSAGIGIEAKVVSSSSGSQLKLTGQSGSLNAFTINASGNAAIGGLLSYSPGNTGGPALTTAAQNAEGLINGSAFVSGTNTVNTSTPGLTLNLASAGKTTLSVAPDNALSKSVSNFVAAYNAVQSNLTALGAENSSQGLNTAYLRGQLSSTLGSSSSLAQVGISLNANGTLNFNDKTLASAIGKSSGNVAGILGSNGLAQRISDLAEGALSPKNLLQLTVQSFNYSGLFGSSTQNSAYSYLGQLGALDNTNTASGFSSQWLLYELSNARQSNGTASGLSGSQFLQSILAQQAFNAGVLGTVGS